MREIKFRAWDGFNKKMIIPASIGIGTQTENLALMQFTGLKDKNGKDIYEGDIVKTKENELLIIEWSKEGHWIVPLPLNSYEVIGNIFENPELLEDKK